jgi:hypothetical protein
MHGFDVPVKVALLSSTVWTHRTMKWLLSGMSDEVTVETILATAAIENARTFVTLQTRAQIA